MMTSFELDNFLPYSMAVTSGKLSKSLSRTYKAYGINRAQWRILVNLGNKPSITSSKIIRHHAQLNKIDFTRAAMKLEAKGWIYRKKNESDGRHKDVCLTANGQSIYQDLIKDVSKWNEELLALIGEDTAQILIETAKIVQEKL